MHTTQRIDTRRVCKTHTSAFIPGLQVEVMDEAQLKAENMHALLSVGKVAASHRAWLLSAGVVNHLIARTQSRWLARVSASIVVALILSFHSWLI